jgi:hypothetical protein
MSRVRRRASLPPSECVYLRELSGRALRERVSALHRAGWSLGDIAHAWDPPKQRSTVKTWADANLPEHTHSHPPLPSPSSSSLSSSSSSSFIRTPENLKSTTSSTSSTSSPTSSAAPSATTAAAFRTSVGVRRQRRVFDSKTIDSATRERIRSLAPLARRYRARANPSGAYAVANEELTELCKDLFHNGTTVRELAETAGVTYRAMARRIGVSK